MSLPNVCAAARSSSYLRRVELQKRSALSYGPVVLTVRSRGQSHVFFALAMCCHRDVILRCDFWLRGSNFANFPIYYVMVKWARAARPYGVGSLRVFYKGLNDLSTWEGLVSRTRRVWSKGIAPDRLAKA